MFTSFHHSSNTHVVPPVEHQNESTHRVVTSKTADVGLKQTQPPGTAEKSEFEQAAMWLRRLNQLDTESDNPDKAKKIVMDVLSGVSKCREQSSIKKIVDTFRSEIKSAAEGAKKNDRRFYTYLDCIDEFLNRQASDGLTTTTLMEKLEPLVWEELLAKSMVSEDPEKKENAIADLCNLIQAANLPRICAIGKILIGALKNKSEETRLGVLDWLSEAVKGVFSISSEKFDECLRCTPEWQTMLSDEDEKDEDENSVFIFARDVIFGDGWNKKKWESLSRASHAEMVMAANKTRLPPLADSKVPRVPTECMMYWLSELTTVLEDKDASLTPERKGQLEEAKDKAIKAWLRHDMTHAHAITCFGELQASFATSFPELTRLAGTLEDALYHLDPCEQWSGLVNLHRAQTDLTTEQKEALASLHDKAAKVAKLRPKGQRSVANPETQREEPPAPAGAEADPDGIAKASAYRAAICACIDEAVECCKEAGLNALERCAGKIRTQLKAQKKIEVLLAQAEGQLKAQGKIGEPLQGTIAELLKESGESGRPGCYTSAEMLPRLNDNVYGRVFESFFIEKLLACDLSPEEKLNTAEFSKALKDILSEVKNSLGDQGLHTLLKGYVEEFGENSRRNFRSWCTEKNVPLFHAFLTEKTAEKRAEKLDKFLDSEKKTGFDDAALSLLNYMIVYLNQMGMKDIVPLMEATDNANISLIQPQRTRSEESNLNPPKTRVIGTTLQYQTPAIHGKDLNQGIRSITENRMNTDKPSATLRQALLHGIATGGVSGSTNLKLHVVNHFRSKGYDIDFRYALLGSMRQFNSGHSLHDALWAANKLASPGINAIDWEVDFRRYGNEEITLDPTKANIMDYEKFFDLFKGTEVGAVMENAARKAMDSTIQYFRDHGDRTKQDLNPEITSKDTADTVSN